LTEYYFPQPGDDCQSPEKFLYLTIQAIVERLESEPLDPLRDALQDRLGETYRRAGGKDPCATPEEMRDFILEEERREHERFMMRNIPKSIRSVFRCLVREEVRHFTKSIKSVHGTHNHSRTPRSTPRPSCSHTASPFSGDDSDPDQPEPPAPAARAQSVHPLTPSKKRKPKYHRPSHCWRVSRSKYGEGGRAA
jgi:hypothetical protein